MLVRAIFKYVEKTPFGFITEAEEEAKEFLWRHTHFEKVGTRILTKHEKKEHKNLAKKSQKKESFS